VAESLFERAGMFSMPIEIEKKYRLTDSQRELILARLKAFDAKLCGTEFETNTLYHGQTIDLDSEVLRLRRVGTRTILTFKKRFASESSIKRQLEEETEVADADATERILSCLGFGPSLVYEKRRQTWKYLETEVVIDELPFGWFMEIEGTETDIERVEREFGIEGLQAEESTYPALTRRYGKPNGDVIEAKF
jgi:adenylate cyclase class 2